MKKFISILLCLVLCLSFCATAFASVPVQDDRQSLDSVSLGKDLQVNQTTMDITADKTFTFKFEAKTTGAPAIDDQTITIAQGATVSSGVASNSLALSAIFDDANDFPHAGTYEYEVTEVIPAAATGTPKTVSEQITRDGGKYNTKMVYDSAKFTVRIFVENNSDYTGLVFPTKSVIVLDADGNKLTDYSSFKFTNTYTEVKVPGPGETYIASVKKVVSGSYADTTEKFPITIALTIPQNMSMDDVDYTVTSGVTASESGSTITVSLAHNESLDFTALPVGTVITVTESAVATYKGTISDGADSAIGTDYNTEVSKAFTMGAAKLDLTVTNEKQDVPYVGVNVDNLPFVVLVVLAVAGLAVCFVSNRRKAEEN